MATFDRPAPRLTPNGIWTMSGEPKRCYRKSSSTKILIAIDFGTTHSAVSWTLYNERSSSKPEVQVVQRWPSKSNTYDKVPTLLHYGDMSPLPSWGFPVAEEDRRYEWFKLEQDPKYTKDHLRRKYPSTAIPPEGPAQVEQLITDYLRLLQSHAEQEIRGHHQRQPASFLDIPWEYIITVPAMWPEPAQNVTLRAAQSARMALDAPIKIIAEPEAAGIYALSTLASEVDTLGHTFMVCDAGGGTVDLISYTITQCGPNPRLAEASPGTGGLCGSSFLDRRFDSWLESKFRYCPDWNLQYQTNALEKWEREIKRDFKGDDSKSYIFNVPGMRDNPALGVKRGKLTVTSRTIKELFRPVVDEILSLVKGQLDTVRQNGSTLKAIYMAGGFGNNDYLKGKIAQAAGAIRVDKMQDCETAIVRGALMRGIAGQRHSRHESWPTVETKRAKTHYGISVLTPFNPRKHDRTRPRVDGGVDGGQRVYIMQWFIEKNKIYRDGQPQDFDFFLDEPEDDVAENGGRLSDVILDIYTCAEDEAPLHPDDPDAPSHQTKCSKIAWLPTKLNLIPINELEMDKGEDGFKWYVVRFKIQMIRNLELVRFDLVFTPSRGPPRTITHVNAQWI